MAADLVGIGQIGVRLIEKISDATGVLYEPTRITRRADAEAKAAIMQAKADVEISDIQRRAAQRFVNEQILYQANMEAIIGKASSRITDDASPEDIGNDWLLDFFDKCRTVSDDEMQEIWAQLLADEAKSPGSKSRKAVNILSDLEPSDARLFRSLCNFRLSEVRTFPFTFEGAPPPPRSRFNTAPNPPRLVILEPQSEFYSSKGADFETLFHLESLGLLKVEPQGYQVGPGKVTLAHSRGFLILTAGSPIPLGRAYLTTAGAQLTELCVPLETPDGFPEYLIDFWRSRGIDVSEDINDVITASVSAYTQDPETGEWIDQETNERYPADYFGETIQQVQE